MYNEIPYCQETADMLGKFPSDVRKIFKACLLGMPFIYSLIASEIAFPF